MYKYMFIRIYIYACICIYIMMYVLYIYIYIYSCLLKLMWFIYVSFYGNPYNIMHVDSIMFIEFLQHMASFLFDVRHENFI